VTVVSAPAPTLIRIAPTTSLQQRATVRVLFDEAHSNSWSARPDVAAQMQSAHPEDSSYASAALHLANRDFAVSVLDAGLITDELLLEVDVLILAHPSDAQWEAVTGTGSPVYTDAERAAIDAFVRRGGGLVVLAETEQGKYGSNLADLVSGYGIEILTATVQDYSEDGHHKAPSWVIGTPTSDAIARDVFFGVDRACFYRTGALAVTGSAVPLAFASAAAAPASAVLAAAAQIDAGRVVVFADSDLFGDDCIDEFAHRQLLLNTVAWAAHAAYDRAAVVTPSPLMADPAWTELHDAVSTLRELQAADGSLDESLGDAATATALVNRVSTSLETLATYVPHQADYIAAARDDLRRWVDGGFGKPDFGPALTAFRPEQHRADGVEHLWVFPMYPPNGGTNVKFEALVVRGPWPSWLAELQRTRFNNAMFVPVQLLGYTAGYASECAVLFPETVSVVGKAPNTFGGIFCDREAGRYVEVTGAAIDACGLVLPPDADGLRADETLMTDTFLLWDLIHDRTHMRGDLPFDPFMIRQRLPFWMYSLEELRCDLTSYVEAAKLEAEFPFARHVKTGVLFDRMLRFPITGNRVRNYDGLGGQVLFGYLHHHGVVRWTDNTLVIDWARLDGAVEDLLNEVLSLYRSGID